MAAESTARHYWAIEKASCFYEDCQFESEYLSVITRHVKNAKLHRVDDSAEGKAALEEWLKGLTWNCRWCNKTVRDIRYHLYEVHAMKAGTFNAMLSKQTAEATEREREAETTRAESPSEVVQELLQLWGPASKNSYVNPKFCRVANLYATFARECRNMAWEKTTLIYARRLNSLCSFYGKDLKLISFDAPDYEFPNCVEYLRQYSTLTQISVTNSLISILRDLKRMAMHLSSKCQENIAPALTKLKAGKRLLKELREKLETDQACLNRSLANELKAEQMKKDTMHVISLIKTWRASDGWRKLKESIDVLISTLDYQQLNPARKSDQRRFYELEIHLIVALILHCPGFRRQNYLELYVTDLLEAFSKGKTEGGYWIISQTRTKVFRKTKTPMNLRVSDVWLVNTLQAFMNRYSPVFQPSGVPIEEKLVFISPYAQNQCHNRMLKNVDQILGLLERTLDCDSRVSLKMTLLRKVDCTLAEQMIKDVEDLNIYHKDHGHSRETVAKSYDQGRIQRGDKAQRQMDQLTSMGTSEDEVDPVLLAETHQFLGDALVEHHAGPQAQQKAHDTTTKQLRSTRRLLTVTERYQFIRFYAPELKQGIIPKVGDLKKSKNKEFKALVANVEAVLGNLDLAPKCMYVLLHATYRSLLRDPKGGGMCADPRATVETYLRDVESKLDLAAKHTDDHMSTLKRQPSTVNESDTDCDSDSNSEAEANANARLEAQLLRDDSKYEDDDVWERLQARANKRMRLDSTSSEEENI